MLPCRVSTWRARVQPIIDEQDARETFDMLVGNCSSSRRLSFPALNVDQSSCAMLA